MSILDETDNFIELHKYASMSGQTEAPPEFMFWSCISLISAAVQNNVWVKKLGKRLFPNLYVFLIGPSSVGKGEAIDSVGVVGRSVKPVHWINTMRSAKSLLDLMTKPDAQEEGKKKTPPVYSWSKIYVIMPELSMAIGTGQQADQFIRLMTGLYSGNPEEIIDEGTRTSGEHSMPMPIINWLCGSTKEWLIESVTRASLYGGFLARCVWVMGDYDLSLRKYNPDRPPDYQDVVDRLRRKLFDLTQLRNVEITLSPEANETLEHWYMSRKAPEPDDPLTPSWKREHDFILKLSTDLVLADNRRAASKADIDQAIALSGDLMTRLTKLIVYAGATDENEAIHRARGLLQRVGKMHQDELIKRLDITAERLKEIRETFEKSHEVRVQAHSGGTHDNPLYVWVDGTHKATEPESKVVQLRPHGNE